MRNPMLKRVERSAVAALATLGCAAVVVPAQAHADSPLSAFCADNAVQLQRTAHESGLDPVSWASDPKNLARFGFSGPGDIDILYHLVVDKGAPYITSHWSNEDGNIQWRCAGQ